MMTATSVTGTLARRLFQCSAYLEDKKGEREREGRKGGRKGGREVDGRWKGICRMEDGIRSQCSLPLPPPHIFMLQTSSVLRMTILWRANRCCRNSCLSENCSSQTKQGTGRSPAPPKRQEAEQEESADDGIKELFGGEEASELVASPSASGKASGRSSSPCRPTSTWRCRLTFSSSQAPSIAKGIASWKDGELIDLATPPSPTLAAPAWKKEVRTCSIVHRPQRILPASAISSSRGARNNYDVIRRLDND